MSGGAANSVEYIFATNSDGFVRYDGSSSNSITYTGLEPITSTITATDVTLNYSTASETITVGDAGGGSTAVTSTAGESVTFINPTGTLTINAGDTGVNTIDVDALVGSYPASLDIHGGNAGDTLNLNGAISFALNKSLTVVAATINLPNSTSDITTSGVGTISLAQTAIYLSVWQ